MIRAVAWAAALVLGAASAHARTESSAAGSSGGFCDRAHALTASQQNLSLRFAAVVREELDSGDGRTALISRSGLDLSRFSIRYSHAAIAWRDEAGHWSARQLYYACDEGRPRLFDQGLPGFTLGIDDPETGYVSIVKLAPAEAYPLRQAALDSTVALSLVGATYSADAFPFSTRYQNCNQWVAELLAVAWGGVEGGPQLRERAQAWLRDAGYTPDPVAVDSHLTMFAASFVPLIHLDDQPEADLFAMRVRVSLPASLEAFVRRRDPGAERVEICHNAHQVVVHRGWTPLDSGCQAGAGDQVLPLD